MRDLAKLNICFIAGTLGQGGAERQLFYVLKALQQAGATVRLLSLTKGEYWQDKIEAIGIPAYWVGRRGSRALRLAVILNLLRRWRVDVIQSQHFYTNLYATTAARLLGKREIGAIRNDCLSEVRSNGAFMGRLSLRLPRAIVANSKTAMRNAVSMGAPAGCLHLLPNVVDTEIFSPRCARAGATVTLLAAGRLTEQKRIDRFLYIVHRLKQVSRVQIRAVVAGDGPLLPQLQARARKLGLLPDTVEFRGTVAEMAPVYKEADVLVSTSDWEGTPNVVLEAMASGLPVVATCVGGVADIVAHGQNGFLLDPASEGQAVEVLHLLVQNRDLRQQFGEHARLYVQRNHSPVNLSRLLGEIYEIALS
jgi:glycosyltransferase involved in cell wall biosynthesis